MNDGISILHLNSNYPTGISMNGGKPSMPISAGSAMGLNLLITISVDAVTN